MIAHVILCLVTLTLTASTLKLSHHIMNKTRQFTQKTYLFELHAHQCGRALAFMKNIQTAAQRLQQKIRDRDRSSKEMSTSAIENTADQIITNIKQQYAVKFKFRDHECLSAVSGAVIATIFLLNSDEDKPETGHYSYRVHNPNDRRIN
jgi:hypothetical protein